MTLRVYLDFETCSKVDVKLVGAYRYAEHWSTRIRMMSYQVWNNGTRVEKGDLCFSLGNDGADWRWLPAPLVEALKFGEVWAHNATFDRLIMEHCVPDYVPKPTFNQWRCTAALARSCGLPGGLKEAAESLRLPVVKEDGAVMRKMHDPDYTATREEWTALRSYCAADVEVCLFIHTVLGDFGDNELVVYQVNEWVNERGVMIDVEACKAIVAALPYTLERMERELPALTGDAVTAATQVQRMKKFVEHALNLKLGSLDADAIRTLMDRDLPADVRRVLEIRQAAGKASTAKYESILHQYTDDKRLHGMFIFAGAGQTGRFSSKGAQLHNLVRRVPDNAAEIIEEIKRSPAGVPDLIYGDGFIDLASQLVRPCLVPAPGNVFVVADYSGVEARGLPWLAGAEHALAPFREGRDPYLDDAAAVFHVKREDVDDYQRQCGKVVRLACGFGGGYNALLAMSRGYGLRLSERDAQTIAEGWHEANPWAREFGRKLYATALEALNSREGRVVKVPGVDVWYCRHRINGIEVLLCCLPSGRVLHYHDVRLNGDVIESRRPRFKNHEALWYGLFSENVTQAVCNDLLRYGMVMLHNSVYALVAHVHDEFVIETRLREGLVEDVRRILSATPGWAATFPLEVKPKIMTKYGK